MRLSKGVIPINLINKVIFLVKKNPTFSQSILIIIHNIAELRHKSTFGVKYKHQTDQNRIKLDKY